MTVSLLDLGECAEAAGLLRTTLVVQARTVGVGDVDTLTIESSLISVVFRLGVCAEAEALPRGALGKMRRILGRDHTEKLTTPGN